MPLLRPKLARLFGIDKDISQIVQSFDPNKINFQKLDNEDFLKVELAPSVGTLTKGDVQLWADELKVIAAVVTRIVEKLPAQNRSWDLVVSAMMQNSALQPDGDGILKTDELVIRDLTFLKRTDRISNDMTKEVQTWLANLVGDEDVLRATPINIDSLTDTFRSIQQGTKGLSWFVRDSFHREKTIMDISVMCYPDISHPYVKMYHIKLTVWSLVDRLAGIMLNKTGMKGEYHCRRFKPRQEVISKLSPRVYQIATQEAEDLFA